MCLLIDSCFGFGAPGTDDDHYHAPAASRTHPRPHPHGQRTGAQYYGNSNGAHYNGNGYSGHKGEEADRRKASNDAHVVPAGAPSPRGWHGHAPATGAQEKMAAAYPHAGADGALKHQQPAAPNGVVAHNYNYYYEPAHKQDAADSYYPAATATADHESPFSEALGRE